MKTSRHCVALPARAILSAAIGVVALSLPPAARANKPPAPGKPETAPVPYTGIKKRIAVVKFDAVAANASSFTGTDIGGGVTAQLTTSLVESGRFVVLERANLGEIQREQQLAAQRAVAQAAPPATSAVDPAAAANPAPDISAPVGKLIDAQILIVGSVTEFEQQASGSSSGIGLSGPLSALKMGRKTIEGHVGLDLRLIDATSGEVVISKHVEARVPQSDVSVDLTVHAIDFTQDNFKNTPLGKAVRSAIDKAVALICTEMEPIPWTGRVAGLLDTQVLVNAGHDMNLQPGMSFVVSSVLKEVTDPSTGLSLGVIEAPRGEIQLDQVQSKFSLAHLVSGTLPKRGDLLRLKH